MKWIDFSGGNYRKCSYCLCHVIQILQRVLKAWPIALLRCSAMIRRCPCSAGPSWAKVPVYKSVSKRAKNSRYVYLSKTFVFLSAVCVWSLHIEEEKNNINIIKEFLQVTRKEDLRCLLGLMPGSASLYIYCAFYMFLSLSLSHIVVFHAWPSLWHSANVLQPTLYTPVRFSLVWYAGRPV